MPHKGTGGREQTLKLHGRNHIRQFRIGIGVILGGIITLKTGGKYDRTDL
jgi:hypothetical protein